MDKDVSPQANKINFKESKSLKNNNSDKSKLNKKRMQSSKSSSIVIF